MGALSKTGTCEEYPPSPLPPYHFSVPRSPAAASILIVQLFTAPSVAPGHMVFFSACAASYVLVGVVASSVVWCCPCMVVSYSAGGCALRRACEWTSLSPTPRKSQIMCCTVRVRQMYIGATLSPEESLLCALGMVYRDSCSFLFLLHPYHATRDRFHFFSCACTLMARWTQWSSRGCRGIGRSSIRSRQSLA